MVTMAPQWAENLDC